MITTIIKQILIDSGCTFVLYESENLSNVLMDQSKQYDIIGLVIQPDEVILEVKANAITEHFFPYYIEIMHQVLPEDTAENNEQIFTDLLNICKKVIIRVINDAEFKKITSVTLTKIREKRYDANVIGWRMPLDLYYLKNELRDPCLSP